MDKSASPGFFSQIVSSLGWSRGPKDLEEQLAEWKKRIVPPTLDEKRMLKEVAYEELEEAESLKPHNETISVLEAMLKDVSEWDDQMRSWLRRAKRLKSEWQERERFTELGWNENSARIAKSFDQTAKAGMKDWFAELFAALDARQFEAAWRIAAHEFAYPQDVQPAVGNLRKALQAVLEEADVSALVSVLDDLSLNPKLADLSVSIDDNERSNLQLSCAWLIWLAAQYNDEKLGDVQGDLLMRIDRAIDLWQLNPKAYAEKSDLLFALNEDKEALENAQRAVEIGPDYAQGYLQLGAGAEYDEQYSDASDYYLAGLERLSVHSIAILDQAPTFSQVTGLLLSIAAQTLHQQGRHKLALPLVDAALETGINGDRDYSEASAYKLRADVLRALSSGSEEIAVALFEAGRHYFWRAEYRTAETCLREACAEEGVPAQAGWYLAETELVLIQAETPVNRETAREIRERWDAWNKKYGPPSPKDAWAYMTRADIEHALLDDGDPWLVLLYGERSLVYEPDDSDRLTEVAGYLRMLGLWQLTYETAKQSRKDSARTHDFIRMSLLEFGRFDEARSAIDRVKELQPNVQVADLYALLAIENGQPDEALRLLDDVGADDQFHIETLRTRAEALATKEDYDEARVALEQLLEQSPTYRSDHLTLALAASVTGDMVKANDYLEAAGKFFTLDIDGPFYAAQAALSFCDWETAAHELRLWIEREKAGWLDKGEERITLFVPAMPDADKHKSKRMQVIKNALDAYLPKRRKQLAEKPESADQELSDAIDCATGEIAATALRAVQARRQLAKGDLSDSAKTYGMLASRADFAREAKTGLETLKGVAVENKDVEALTKVLDVQVAAEFKNAEAATFELAGAYEEFGHIDDALNTYKILAQSAPGSDAGVEAIIKASDMLLRDSRPGDAYTVLKDARNLMSSQPEAPRYGIDRLNFRAAAAAAAARLPEKADELKSGVMTMVRLQREHGGFYSVPTDFVPSELALNVRDDELDRLSILLSDFDDESGVPDAVIQQACKTLDSALNAEGWAK